MVAKESLRKQFKSISKGDLHYLDSAATTLKPQTVIERISKYYNEENGSPNRGAHKLSVQSTRLYHQSKERVKTFIHATQSDEVVYTKNATEALNLLATSLPDGFLSKGDKLVISITAHHSNILPWQRLAKKTGATLVYMYCDEEGQITPLELEKIDKNTKLVSIPIISNGNGIIHPAKVIFERANQVGALSVADAAQAVGHIEVNFKDLDCDFLVFSGHKLYGPQGIGALVAKRSALEILKPYILGGDMIEYVTEQEATFADIPERFEAGTQNVAGAVGLMSAIDWIEAIGIHEIIKHNKEMTAELYTRLSYRSDIVVYGPIHESGRGSIVTFNVLGIHPHDVATILDTQGVAIRAGHHCCQPLMSHMGVGATCRASVGIYTTVDDIQALEQALDKVQEVFKQDA